MAFVLYLLVGASAPLFHTPVLKNDTMAKQLPVSAFYGAQEGPDRAMLLESNQSALEQRIRLLNQAEHQIILTTFDMRDGESTRDLLSVLLQKAEKGVKIKILVDGLNGWYHLECDPVFRALATNDKITFKLYNPVNLVAPWDNQYRLHDKFIIVDDLGYIIGGRNTHDYFLGDTQNGHQSLDREVLVYNTLHGTEQSAESSLSQLTEYFNQMWDSTYCSLYGESTEPSLRQQTLLRELQEHYPVLVHKNVKWFESVDWAQSTVATNKIQLLYNDPRPVAKEPVLFYQLCQLMADAKQQATFFSPYMVCNTYMLQSLQHVAENGAEDRIVINSVENGDNIVASSDYLRHKEEVLRSGFSIYEYDGGTSTHGKSLSIDGRLSIIGSFNLDLRSTYLSTETMVVIDSTALTAQLNQNFQAMEQKTRQLLDADTYDIPEDLTIASMSVTKKLLLWVAGVFLQPFRLTI